MRIVSDRIAIREATSSEIGAILGWTHRLWGDGLDFEGYRERTERLMATPWGQANYRFLIGCDAQGRPVTSCKRYRLSLRLYGTPVTAVGFGAVFTPPGDRGQGYAAEMIRAVMRHEASLGTRMALLYSDIGADFYVRLGFKSLGGASAQAEALPAKDVFRLLDSDEHSLLPRWQQAMPPGDLAFERSADYWEFLQERAQARLFAYCPFDDSPRGFVAVQVKPDRVFVEEVAYEPTIRPEDFYLDMRSLGGSLGVPLVTGWLPPAAEAAGFAFLPHETALPMAADLQGGQVPRQASLWAIDHF